MNSALNAVRLWRRLTALIACGVTLMACAAAPANAAGTTGASTPCSSASGGHGVSISSCSYTLTPSPGGNANYFINVTIKYVSPNPGTAVRFRCALANASTTVAQYGVLRASGQALTFVSPFVSSASEIKSVACSVDAA